MPAMSLSFSDDDMLVLSIYLQQLAGEVATPNSRLGKVSIT